MKILNRGPCSVVYADIRDLYKNFSDSSRISRGGNMFFFLVLRLVSPPGATIPTHESRFWQTDAATQG